MTPRNPRTPRRRRAARPAAVAAVAAALLLGTAPAHAEPLPTGGPVGDGSATARVRVVDLVPGSSGLRVTLVPFAGAAPTSTSEGTPLGYGDVSAYRDLPAGYLTATVAGAGSRAPQVIGAVRADAGRTLTVVLLGTPTSTHLTTVADSPAPPQTTGATRPGTARLRILAGVPSLRSAGVTAVHGPVLAAHLGYGSATGYGSLPAGSWELELDDPASGAVSAAPLGRVPLAAGDAYTLMVLHHPDSRRPYAVLLRDQASGAAAVPVAAPLAPDGAAAGRLGTLLLGALEIAVLLGAGVILGLRRRRTRRSAAPPEPTPGSVPGLPSGAGPTPRAADREDARLVGATGPR